MKKITFLLALFTAFCINAQDPSLVLTKVDVTPSGGSTTTYNSQGEWITAITNGNSKRELEGGTTYKFYFDYANIPATGTWNNVSQPNKAIVRLLHHDWSAAQTELGADIDASGTGSTSVSITVNEAAYLGVRDGNGDQAMHNGNPNITDKVQFRTMTTTFTGGASPDNTFLFDFVVAQGSLSSSEYKEEYRFTMYPNPVKNTIYLKGNDLPTKYKITTLLGSVVQEGTFEGSIDASKLASGMYFLVYDDKTYNKFIKE